MKFGAVSPFVRRGLASPTAISFAAIERCDCVISLDEGTIELIVSRKRRTEAELQMARQQHATDVRMERAKRAATNQAVMQQKRVGQ